MSPNLPGDVDKFAPGWKVRDWGGPAMKPGLRAELLGRSNVLLTHPLSRDVPCVLSRRVDVPVGKTTELAFTVNNHPRGDWKLVVRVDGRDVLTKSIGASKWQEFHVDLTKHAGQTIVLELENRATDWAFEAGYWRQLRVRSK